MANTIRTEEERRMLRILHTPERQRERDRLQLCELGFACNEKATTVFEFGNKPLRIRACAQCAGTLKSQAKGR